DAPGAARPGVARAGELAHLLGELVQPLDAGLDRRVGREEVGQALTAAGGMHDVEGRRRLGAGGLLHRPRLNAVVELGEGAGKGRRVVDVVSAAVVGLVLAGAGDAELDQARGDWGEYEDEQSEKRITALSVTAAEHSA